LHGYLTVVTRYQSISTEHEKPAEPCFKAKL